MFKHVLRLALAILAPIIASNSVQSQESTTRVPTIADFAELPFLSEPSLSPDGSRVAARIAINGEQMLGVLNIDNPGPPVIIPLRDNDLIEWSWVNDDWLVARLGDKGMIETFPVYITRVVSIRADGKEVHTPGLREAGQHAEVIWTANDKSPRILVTMQKSIFDGLDFWPSVHEVDVSTGRIKQVEDPVTGVLNWYADAAGTVRVGSGYDNRFEQWRIFYRANARERFRILDKATFANNESIMIPVVMPEAVGSTFVYSDHEGFDWLYELDLKTFQPGKPAASVPGYDLSDVYTSTDGARVVGVEVTTNRRRILWTDAKLAALQSSLEKSVEKGQWVNIEGWNRDFSRFIVHVGNAASAGIFYVYHADDGSLRRLGRASGSLVEPVSTVSTIRYKARDGLEIPAILTLPKSRPGKALPLILLPHGGPNARDEEQWDHWTQFLAFRGYAVIQPNYRGSTGYGNAFLNAGDGEWGLKMQDDLNDAVDHLARQGVVDPKRVCVLGGSYGGYAAMRAATRDGERFRCAISFAGVADLAALNRYDRNWSFSRNSSTAWLKKRAADFDVVSPLRYAERAATPVLLVHGKKDVRVPVDQSRDFAKALQKAGKTVRYVELPEGDHGLSRQEDRLTFLTEVDAFLAKYNPAN